MILQRLKGLASDSAIYGVSGVLSQLIGLILFPLYIRYLEPFEYGMLLMFTLVTPLIEELGNVGMSNAVFKFFHANKEHGARQTTLSTGVISVALCSLLVFLIGQALAPQLTDLLMDDHREYTYLTRLFLITTFLSSVGRMCFAILRAERRAKTLSSLNIGLVVISAGANILLVVVFDLGIAGMVYGNLLGQFIISMFRFWIVRDYLRPVFDKQIWRDMFYYGGPFLPHRLQMNLVTAGSGWLIGNMLGLVQAGYYNVALKFAVPLSFVISAFQVAWTPIKFQIHSEDKDAALIFRSIFTYYFTAITWLWLGLSVWGPEILYQLAEPEYHPAGAVIAVIALSYHANGIYAMVGTGIELGKTKLLPLISFVGMIVSLSSAWFLLPRIGAHGGPAAMTVSWLTMAGMIFYISQRQFKIDYDWPSIFTLAALAGGLFFLDNRFEGLSIIPRLAITVVICTAFPIVALLILLRSSTERHRMKILLEKFAVRFPVIGKLAARLD